jgi:CubicO group peptidase (beta-lactamase class C family)
MILLFEGRIFTFMKRKKNAILLIIVFLSLLSTNLEAQNSYKSFNRKMNFWMWLYHIPGAQVVLIKNDKIVHHYNYGSTEYKGDHKIKSSTKFQVGKVNQIFTALWVMQEVNKGNLKWNTSINSQLKQFSLRQSSIVQNRNSTLLQLLNHSSGVNRKTYKYHNNQFPVSDKDLLFGSKLLGKKKLLNFQEPLKSYLYSEGAFVLAGLAAKEKSNRDMPSFYHSEINSKINIKGYFDGEEVAKTKRAEAHDYSKKRKTTPLSYPHKMGRGFWISATDYFTLLQSILSSKAPETYSISAKDQKYFTKGFISIEKSAYSSCVVFEKNEDNPSLIRLVDDQDGFRSYFYYNKETKDGFVLLLNSEYDYWLSRKKGKIENKLVKLIKKKSFDIF